MQSGAPIPVGDTTNGQEFYDDLVNATGCTSAADTLQCLREVPFETLMDAVNNTPNIFGPRVSKSDGHHCTNTENCVAGSSR